LGGKEVWEEREGRKAKGGKSMPERFYFFCFLYSWGNRKGEARGGGGKGGAARVYFSKNPGGDGEEKETNRARELWLLLLRMYIPLGGGKGEKTEKKKNWA